MVDQVTQQTQFKPRQFGKYLLLERIGVGGMAEIFKAVAKGAEDFKKVLVIKRILLPYSKDPNFVRMFIEEAKMCASLQHPNIVTIYEFDQIEGQYYIAMEYVHGKDLQKTMARANRMQRRFPIDLTLYLVGEVCKALSYAYNARDPRGNPLKIIHRDVSPSNIIISFEGNVKVTDFGVAKAQTSKEKGPALLKGKLGYMSPEQVTGKELDHRSDIFSLGIILFECITLKRLFLGRTDLQTLINIKEADLEKRLLRHPEIPEGVANILRKAVAREKENRYENAQAFLKDIEDYLYQERKRPSSQDLQAFMHDLFPEEAEAEILPLDIEEAEVGLGLPGAPKPEGAVQSSEVPRVSTGEVKRVERPASIQVVEKPVAEELPPTRQARISPQATRFYLQDSKGNRFGPLTFENLLNLVKSHAVREDELCSTDGETWTQVKEVTGLKPSIEEEVRIFEGRKFLGDGVVSPERCVYLFYDLSRKKRLTGVVVCRKGGIEKEVGFKGGRIKYVTSTARDELFGEFLVRVGAITREQLEQVLGTGLRPDFKLGDALVASGVIKPHVLPSLLERHLCERFWDIFKWERGWYGIYEQGLLEFVESPFELDPIPLLAEAARSYIPLHSITALLADYWNKPLIKAENPRVSISELRLKPKEARVVSLLEATETIAETIKALKSKEGEELVQRIAFLLLQTEIYHFKLTRGEKDFIRTR
jgi:serine/threonine-protein kinase